ncbi:hypothetical protein [Caballeronia sp.]|uniref:hypothetical protein n=1 Tax=Caballeronia sp. TaxID=1931223 RepID=UPI003C50D65A
MFSGALGLAVTFIIALSAQASQAQARGGTLNFVVTPEPTALVDLATTAINVLKVSQRAKKRSKETRFKPPTFKCRRCSFQVFGTNVARPQTLNPQSNPRLKHQRRAHASPRRPQSHCCRDSYTREKALGNARGIADRGL